MGTLDTAVASPPPVPAAHPARPPHAKLRVLVASFWLRILFAIASDLHWLATLGRRLFIWGACTFSPKIQRNTALNAERIFRRKLSFDERHRFAWNVVSSFYDFVVDIGRSVRMSRDAIYRRIERVEGEHHYLAARAMGKGAVVVTAHMGSFEVGLVGLLQRERDIHVVFKRDEFDWFEQLRSKMRQRLGVHEAPVDQGWAVWLGLRDALLRDEVVVLQGDRVLPGQKGQAVRMFDAHVMLPTGPIKLALAAGAPVVPIFTIRTRRGKVGVYIEEPIIVSPECRDITEPMQKLARTIEKFIQQYPDQWLVLDRAFCEDIRTSSAKAAS